MTIYLALGALFLSAIPVILLCVGDPKRRRAAGERGGAASRPRSMFVIMACIPGFACALLGDSAAFMLWLGGTALLGWAAAASFVARSQDRTY
ncbi:hypothetical protein [Sphingomonas psychrotolerans]|uniref:Uncharacterized protein n=1 Tax=Sphingomonas psychrotolerans TaxID=1327635 RepID=A0A2K8MGF9_9SPHN|nr:hypothetical protein [Sphingomonas psychrotolerans]ATY32965.1 hypothetical protein CVN68_14165 [Sphingomonas psychrotolerans]